VKKGEKPRANPLVVLREEFDDWAVLFDPDAGQGFGLNPTGVYVWKLLDGKHSVDDMLEALHRDADGVPQEAGEHIVTFLEELTEHGLAGYEGEQQQGDRRRLPLCPTCTGTMQFKYEPSRLIDLRGAGAHGVNCNSSGSEASSDCMANGASATNVCQPGTLAITACRAGTSASIDCCGGSTRSFSWCGGGSSPACCGSGSGGY
jgi:SynChlorMet cassette protein ScmD